MYSYHLYINRKDTLVSVEVEEQVINSDIGIPFVSIPNFIEGI